MYSIRIITVGKTREAWLQSALLEYTKRLSGSAKITWILAKDDSRLESMAKSEKELICLDSKGALLTSAEFSRLLLQQLESHGSKICFFIGGPEGIPDPIKKEAPSISLSKMTFTHQMTRLILLEQIYRALEITKGSKYHK